jgi:uncharacterized protein YdaU (DUF1376 family)
MRKLVRFFSASRDGWKTKCKAAKKENKSLKQRLAKMTENRDRWKSRAQRAEKAAPALADATPGPDEYKRWGDAGPARGSSRHARSEGGQGH